MRNTETMPPHNCMRAAALCAGLALPIGAMQAETPFVNDPEMDVPSSVTDPKKWKEQGVRMPAWPRDGDLVEIKVDGPDGDFRHSIDIRSLSNGSDGVVRYTLVTESASGALNVSYEGLRCAPRGKYKTYAYGSGSSFSPTGVAEEWRTIDERSYDRFRHELWRHYLCVPRLFAPRDRKDQIRMLKSGRVPQTENAGFLTN
ncbi:MAG: CNP1-like family protein [Thiohalocapsa sp.]